MTRKITPHKGGRRLTLNLRLTDDEKFLITEAADIRKKSLPDFILEAVRYFLKGGVK